MLVNLLLVILVLVNLLFVILVLESLLFIVLVLINPLLVILHTPDTTVLSPVVSPESEGSQVHFDDVKAFGLHKLKLSQKRICWNINILQGAALAYPQSQLYDMWGSRGLTPNHNCMTCGGPEVLPPITVV